MTINLATGSAAGDGTDTIEQVEDVHGSPERDIITGFERPNYLSGDGGNDDVLGAGDDDGWRGTTTKSTVALEPTWSTVARAPTS